MTHSAEAGPGDRARLLLCLAAAGVLLAGCGGTTAGHATSATRPMHASPDHAALDLEALLPGRVAGRPLAKRSATGALVLEGTDAFSRALRRVLARSSKRPADLEFANAQDPTGGLELEVGVFRVQGMTADALRDGIVESTRPNAPGLAVTHPQLGRTRVTRLVYPGGSTLYLEARNGVVYYVGTQDAALAARVLARLP